jgi:large subunit ribosomal protein L21
MYAVIETGGKQYRVTPGESIEIESLTGDVGAEVEFNRVLAVVDGDAVKAGAAAEGALVKGTIAAHGRNTKTLVFKFKRKKQYKRTIGHRQNFTRVNVNEIVG